MSQSQGLTLGAVVMMMFPAITGLIGVIVGVYAASRNQRKLWIVDNKRAEYRKLLTTLTRTFLGIARLRALGVALGPREQRKVFTLEIEALAVIRDRLFIADEIQDMNLLTRWIEALHDFDHTLDYDAFANQVGLITKDIKQSAKNIFKEKDWMEWLDDSSFCASIKQMEASRK